MKFIEHSNSVYKSNEKFISPRKRKIRKITFEIIIFSVILCILLGILSEIIQSNNALNSLRKSHKLGGYGEYKISYGVSGSGDNLVLFEPNIGGTLLEFNPIVRESLSGVKMIYYDRFGYGGSEAFKDKIDIKTQSDILSNLIKNTGYEGKEILVSSGYGSLIHLEYLKNNGGNVGGMILIDPYIFNKTPNSFLNKIKFNIKNAFLRMISFLNIPRVLSNFSLDINPNVSLYKEKGVSRNLDNYISRMLTSDYYNVVHREKNAYETYMSSFNLDSLGTYDIPVIIIESEENKGYKEALSKHFKNLEVIYFEDIKNFTYEHSTYLRDLILNINQRING